MPTRLGYLYLAVVVDACSQKVVGWEMADHLRTELVLDPLDMAAEQCNLEETIHHSDQGCRHVAIVFGKRFKDEGVRPPMGSVGDCWDRAMAESSFSTLECEPIDPDTFATKSEARLMVFDYIEGFYNPHRLHSALSYNSPVSHEEIHDSPEQTLLPERRPLAGL